MEIIGGGNTLLDVNFILEKIRIAEKTKLGDFGCGSTGIFAFTAAKLVGKEGRVYVVDILKPVLENLKRRARLENYDNIDFIWSDLEIFKATKIESGTLDAGLLINTLHLSHKRQDILRESIRMIKRNGRLAVIEWKNISIPFGPPLEERVEKDLLEILAKKLGLRPDEQFEAGPYHYGMVFVKL